MRYRQAKGNEQGKEKGRGVVCIHCRSDCSQARNPPVSLSLKDRKTDRRTDGRTDGQTDREAHTLPLPSGMNINAESKTTTTKKKPQSLRVFLPLRLCEILRPRRRAKNLARLLRAGGIRAGDPGSRGACTEFAPSAAGAGPRSLRGDRKRSRLSTALAIIADQRRER